MSVTRRDALCGLGATAMLAAAGGGRASASGHARPAQPSDRAIAREKPARREFTLTAAERDASLLGNGRPTSRVWSYADEPIPILRTHVGDTIHVRLENRLPQHTSIHSHGVRLPNAMDGVPYLTQKPVDPGESFSYEFVAPDPGTFFLHPHCNESGQSGRGLLAALIIDGDERPGNEPDADIVIAIKDWRLNQDGSFLPFESREGAGRAGTFGTMRGVNGVVGPLHASVPAGGDVRLRILNLDGTRIVQVGVENGEAAVIATDGHAIQPFPLDTWRLGPAMRVDLVVRAPARAGEVLQVIDYGAAEPWTVATLQAVGPSAKRRPFDPKGLVPARVPRARTAGAERLSFTFGATSGKSLATEVLQTLPADDPLAKILLDSLCVRDSSLWAINGIPWPAGKDPALPPPLGRLQSGRPYVFELVNVTPHPHPIHLHGHTFELLRSSRQKQLPRHLADTVIINPRERVEIAFVAAKGDWMLHCHILEHLEYGMMGYLRVG